MIEIKHKIWICPYQIIPPSYPSPTISLCAPWACHAAQLTSRHTKEPSHWSTQDHREIFTASHWPTQTYNTDRQEENIADETNSDQSRVS